MSHSEEMILMFCLVTLTSVTVISMLFTLKKKKDRLVRELAIKDRVLIKKTEELRELKAKHYRAEAFQNNLAAAEHSIKTQRPLPSADTSPPKNSALEKYRLVHALIKKQMSVDEIASFLTVSAHEARQLVTLSKLVQ
ncbi:MAG: hypothetical protein JRC87_08365 [Deltaproteobacteria bacterium]|nr:hypothetical protein [Deltaproteobacteria bacterium]MBW2659584.1 hypothetical protein [Deltaproteobacteria bacterium]